MTKFVAHSSRGKIMFGTLFCRNSCSAFHWATVSLECETGQAFTRGLDLDVLQCMKQILRWAGECISTRSWPKMKKNYCGAALPWHSQIKRGHNGVHFPHTLGPYGALVLRLWRSTWPPKSLQILDRPLILSEEDIPGDADVSNLSLTDTLRLYWKRISELTLVYDRFAVPRS